MYQVVGFWENLLYIVYSLFNTFLARVEGFKEEIFG